jgi:hypothetical protein
MAAALPMVRTWFDTVRAQHAGQAQRVGSVGFSRLPEYFPSAVLDAARVVTVAKIPFPPITDLGIAFAELSQMGLSAVTYDDTIFVHQALRAETIHFHELVHVVQWRAIGVNPFMLTYGLGVVERGYAHSPLEAIAYDLQSQFDRGVAVADLEAAVTAHARAAWSHAASVFAGHGIAIT